MNIYESQLRQVTIINLLHYGTNKLQNMKPYNATNVTLYFDIEKKHLLIKIQRSSFNVMSIRDKV
jgi:hypothetical protein